MISVKKDFAIIPNQLGTENCKEKIKEALTEKNSHKFSRNFYGHDDVKDALNKLYHKKCAYCETNTSAGASLQVEHFRPKAKVTEVPFDATTGVGHRGYYWLGYEWSNLLLSCAKCNEQGAKGNHFPITDESNRITNHPLTTTNELDRAKCLITCTELANEKPLLLNPETDEVEKHLIFLPDGTVKGITPQGKKTVEILKLNREDLVLARKKKVDDIFGVILRDLVNFLDKQIDNKNLLYNLSNTFNDMLNNILDVTCEYSRLHYFMWDKFDYFFTNRLTIDDAKQKLKEAREAFVKKFLS